MSLELVGVTVRRQQRIILDDVSLTVEPGEVVALVGPNGAGKSTLLAVCAGEISPDHGSVHWEGTNLARFTPPELALVRSHLRQEHVAAIPFSAREVVSMGRYALQRAGATDRETDARVVLGGLQTFDVTAFADRAVRTLSGGERARVAIARTMVQHAPLILLDEPTAALDLAHQERILERVAAETRWDAAVVTVLHDLNLAAGHAQRIVVVSSGTIVADGPPIDVLQDELLTEVYRRPLAVVDHPFRDVPLVVTRD
jgi:iron complex transport system ATP-binding protein